METKRICSYCGKTLAANTPEGLCPECLLKAGLGSGMDLGADTEAGASRPGFVPPTVAELAPLFPQLEIIELIGQGGMGAVYKARQKELERTVALKILPPGIGQDSAFAGRFAREAKALARLNHPGIVTLYEFGKVNPPPVNPAPQPPLYYFLMEFVDGVNLRQLLSASRLAPREALAIVPQICDALQYAHDAGIVHRDIKPENILLDRRGRVKVADFGLAKLVGNSDEAAAGGATAAGLPALTATGKIMGTPQYMAPEQVEHPAAVDHRADIYALGVVFYQMLTGELPGKQIEPPSRKVQIDVRLDEIVLRAMEKNPKLRYQQVSEVKTRVATLAATSSAGSPAAAEPGAGEFAAREKFGVWLPLVLLAGVLALLFWRSFVPGQVLFSNDSPLGIRLAGWMQLPAGLLGRWDDLNGLGFNAGSYGVSISTLILWVLGPLGASKFLAPVILCLLGLCAWFSFQRLRLTPFAALLGALGVALSSNFFSAACWGVASTVLGIGMSYLAIGLVASANRAVRPLERRASFALAGLAAGVGIIEAADIGVVFGLVVLAFVVFCSLVEAGSFRARAVRSVLRVLVVGGFAFLMAGQTFIGLINTQASGVTGPAPVQDAEWQAQRWDWATQWSLPKAETLSLVVPGLFGYRMDTSDGGNYRGGIGRTPAIDRWIDNGRQGPQPQGLMRFAGGGGYVGLPVALVALWTALQSLRRRDSVFTLPERRMIWFWCGLGIVCLLLAFGRFAPFYHLLRGLPYFSTFRNPIQFLNPMIFSVSILFAHGLDALWRQYMAAGSPVSAASGPGNWWRPASRFDRRWTIACALALGLILLAWMVYASSRESLAHAIGLAGFDEQTSQLMAAFSIRQTGWFALAFILAAGLLSAIIGSGFTGPRAKWGASLLGLLLVCDLSRANLPWIIHYDYREKYATNDVLEFLRQKPCEHRVAGLPWVTTRQSSTLDELYRIEWAQHHFFYYNIQSLDLVQIPRMPADLAAFEAALRPEDAHPLFRLARRWQLTNTRYLLGPASGLNQLNAGLRPGDLRFRIARGFDLVPKPGVTKPAKLEDLTAVFNPDGQYAIFEFTDALPRAKMYSHWQVTTNDQAALAQLGSAAFDPQKTVLVDSVLPGGQMIESGGNGGSEGTVEFADYSSKHIVLKTRAELASVLLLNDRFDPAWRVTVDGKPASLLRCNYIMRGVQLAPGDHTIEFTFEIAVGLPFARVEVEPDTQLVEFIFKVPTGLPSYFTLLAFGAGFILLVVLRVAGRRNASSQRRKTG
ncbi:MAG: protein kinase [Verrucomicrobiae bacterium]|nr:protein kinase [Verrucomicrobiae bacterium]